MQISSFPQHLKLGALALALSLSLAACTSTSPTSTSSSTTLTTAHAFGALTFDQAKYQDMLSKADANSRFPALILLTRSSIVARDYNTAAGLLATMQQEAITPLQKDQVNIIEALLYLHQGKTTEAVFNLSKVNVNQLPKSVASFYYQLSSNVELKLYQESQRKDHLLKACKDKIMLLNFVNDETKRNVSLQVVKHLQSFSGSELTVQSNKSNDSILQGFFDFALIDSSKSLKIKQQLAKDWLAKYNKHPLVFAAEKLTKGENNAVPEQEFTEGAVVALKEGDKLAVLLPLTGRFASSVGEPARLGILAALQDRNSKLQVTFYDTNRMTMEEISSSLGQNGTNFIIGPILKPEVDALLATNIKLPTIVFNQPAKVREQMYYFNLGPDYEGALAASKIYYDGKIRPVVIAPESTRGQRAIAGFNEVWQQASTQEATVCRYGDINTINIALTTCPVNNADAIYVNATANEVIKVRPSLPDNTPLYLTNRSYVGVNHSSAEVALAGAKLGDMPWLLTDSALKTDLMASLPKADPQVQRIFATAYDSINLSFNLTNLAQNQNDVLHGLSGDLQLGKAGLIEMAPMWVTLSVNRQVN